MRRPRWATRSFVVDDPGKGQLPEADKDAEAASLRSRQRNPRAGVLARAAGASARLYFYRLVHTSRIRVVGHRLAGCPAGVARMGAALVLLLCSMSLDTPPPADAGSSGSCAGSCTAPMTWLLNQAQVQGFIKEMRDAKVILSWSSTAVWWTAFTETKNGNDPSKAALPTPWALRSSRWR